MTEKFHFVLKPIMIVFPQNPYKTLQQQNFGLAAVIFFLSITFTSFRTLHVEAGMDTICHKLFFSLRSTFTEPLIVVSMSPVQTCLL